jgi:LysM repeat protein
MKRLPWLAVWLTLLLLVAPVTLVFADTIYTVQSGDTLSSIARAHGVTVQAIVEANNIANPNLIIAGQVLTIPGVSGLADISSSAGATPTPAPVASPNDETYTVQPGDSLSKIAALKGVTVQAIAEANGIEDLNLIRVGQVLIIPGTAGATGPAANTPAPTPVPATPAPAPVSTNLLPNPSFEEGWYFFNGVNELQVPNGWLIAVDEGPNTLDPGSGGLFLRPECRVIPFTALPEFERDLFIWDGSHTVKIFKGSGPTSFSLFTDVFLQPGAYRFTINFFPDLVAAYAPGGQKTWATDPLSGEVRIIHGSGGGNWTTTTIGAKNTMTYDFTVTTPGAVRLGASFRNRWALPNNGWFLDAWSLQRTGNS